MTGALNRNKDTYNPYILLTRDAHDNVAIDERLVQGHDKRVINIPYTLTNKTTRESYTYKIARASE